jgi:hypothetical protein
MELWKGSANTQLSILRRKKVLAINKSKIELATQPLPNAKKLLFGEDFPSIASKEAELSRGLAKNLAPVRKLPKTKPGYGSRDSRYQPLQTITMSSVYFVSNFPFLYLPHFNNIFFCIFIMTNNKA